jgi:hypothetical protein
LGIIVAVQEHQLHADAVPRKENEIQTPQEELWHLGEASTRAKDSFEAAGVPSVLM